MKILKLNPQKSRAQAMVEFAIVLPILLLILYGLIETGRYLLIVSSVNSASRQAARWGSTVGVDPTSGVPRYQDCDGIKNAALKINFMRSFAANNITIRYDDGPTTPQNVLDTCDGSTDIGVNPSTNNTDRIEVTISAQFKPMVPLVPFQPRTITATSYRTIVRTITIAKSGSKEATTVTITTNPSGTSEIGQSVIVTVTVSGVSSTPTGTVDITGTDGDCSITLSGGTGSCTVKFDSYTTSLPETRNIVATYTGDANHNPGSSSVSHIVTKASTTTTITADSPDPSAANAQVAVTVSVTSAWGTPTGTISITGADTNCTITLPAGSCNVTFTSIGSKTLTATYNGDAEHNTSNDTASHAVINANDTTSTICTPSTSSTLSANLCITVGGLTTPQGTVVFTEGATTLCTFTLTNGGGSCNYTFSSPGAKNVTATYTSTNGLNGSSTSKTITVGATGVTLSAGTPSNGVVPITATVTGNGTPTGTVAITGADTNCTITLVNGTGTCNVTFNSSVTNKTLTGTYSGDSTHAPGTGTVNVTVTVMQNISCAISSYTVNNWNDGNGGFGATIGIQNTGTTTINNGWTLTWTFPGTQQVTQMWNPSTYSQSGAVVTATSSTTNGGAAINAGATFSSMGFNGTNALPYPTNNYPTDFKLNGVSCTPPPVANCSSSTIVLGNLNINGGTLNLPINNSLPSAILIKDVLVTWYDDKGHTAGGDKSLIMLTASIGGVTFWTGADNLSPNAITPASPTYIPTGTSTMSFSYHQTQDRWKITGGQNGDTVTINLSTPGCETVTLSQDQH